MTEKHDKIGIDVLSFSEEPETQEIEDPVVKEEEEPSIEDMIEQIDAISAEMEEGHLSLEDSFRKYKQGMDLVKQCSRQISVVEKQMQIIDEQGGLHDF